MVIDAATRAFSRNQALFTQALSRPNIIGTPFSKELFDLVDAIWLQDGYRRHALMRFEVKKSEPN